MTVTTAGLAGAVNASVLPTWLHQPIATSAVICLAAIVVALLVAQLVINRRAQHRILKTAALLRSQESRWRELTEAVPAGIFEADANGHRQYANAQLLNILGESSEYADDDQPTECGVPVALIHDADRTRVVVEWAAARATMSTLSTRLRIVKTSTPSSNDVALAEIRTVRWLRVEATPQLRNGELVGWRGSIVDFTEDETEAGRMRRLTEILEATPDLVAMVDTEGRFTYANSAARRLFDGENLLTSHAVDIYAPHERARFFSEAIPTAERDGMWSGEIDLAMHGGGYLRCSQVLIAHRRDDGSTEYFSSITRDLSERRAFEEQLQTVARFDALTALPNRATFVDSLTVALDRERRTGQRLAVLLINIDNFSFVNESLGHAAADSILVEVGRRIATACGAGGIVARLGSDEFAVLSRAQDAAAAKVAAERIGNAIAEPMSFAGEEVFLTASTGLVCSSADPLLTPETMLRDAEIAMRRAKERGRSRYETYVQDYRQTAVHRLRIANDLHRALADGDLRVAYQPEVDIATGHVVGVEALVRWLHPERGVIQPSEFIPLAEQTGLINDIGTHVLNVALAQAASWSQSRYDGGAILVWVNLSARQLVDNNLVEMVSDLLNRHGVQPSQLGLEVTESALLADMEAAISMLSRLHELGVRLAVDDFGTGFSSLAYLKRLPIDTVKIDRSFVGGLGKSAEDTAIIAGVTSMTKALGLSTVAEGIETAEQFLGLRDLGCDVGQGYLFATPQTARRITRLLLVDRTSPVGRFAAAVPPSATPAVVPGLITRVATSAGGSATDVSGDGTVDITIPAPRISG